MFLSIQNLSAAVKRTGNKSLTGRAWSGRRFYESGVDEAGLRPTARRTEARLCLTELCDARWLEQEEAGAVARGRRIAAGGGNGAAERIPNHGQRGPQWAKSRGEMF